MGDIATISTMIFAVGTLGAIGVISVYLVSFFFRSARWVQAFHRITAQYTAVIGTVLVVGGISGTLVFSELVQYTPCELCWWQRIALYPQLVLFAVALWRGVLRDAVSLFILSGIGVVFSVIHIVTQATAQTSFVCGLGGGESCTTIYFLEFGFITMPVMALTLFVLLILILAVHTSFSRFGS